MHDLYSLQAALRLEEVDLPLIYALFRPLIFLFPAEFAHHLGLTLLRAGLCIGPLRRLLRWWVLPKSNRLKTQLWGQTWDHPIGLAAGLDKAGDCCEPLAALGFGAIEVGTVTAKPQPGNPKPRLFRLPKDQAIVNRFGFNNPGCEGMAANLRDLILPCPLGINLGKSKVTPNEDAIEDYLTSLHCLKNEADYVVVNVSSPNTPGLRDLQAVDQLRPLLTALQHVCGDRLPLVLKIAPDLADEDLMAVADLAVELSLDGLIANNTTIGREGLKTSPAAVDEMGAGGLSGPPLRDRSRAVLRILARHLRGKVPIIAVGGIDDGEEAYRRIRMGASAVQIYTGFVYGGPFTAARMAKELDQLLARDGFRSVTEAIGVDLESQ